MAILFGDKHPKFDALGLALWKERRLWNANDLGLHPSARLHADCAALGQVTILVSQPLCLSDGAAVGGWGMGRGLRSEQRGKQQAGSLLLVLALFFEGVCLCVHAYAYMYMSVCVCFLCM